MTLKNHVKTKMDPSYKKSHDLIGQLSELNIKGGCLKPSLTHQNQLHSPLPLLFHVNPCLLSSAILLGVLITRSIAKPVKTLEYELNTLSNSGCNLANPIDIEAKDEIGKWRRRSTVSYLILEPF